MNQAQVISRILVAVVFAASVSAICLPAIAADAEPVHVWVHYDYMVFPPGWTSAAGITYPHGLSMAPPPAAIEKVVDAYAAQGLTLHIDPIHNAIAGHQVVIPDFVPQWKNATQACVGSDAVSFLALKAQYFRAQGNHPWHYAIFGFNAGLPDIGTGSLCPADQLCLAYPDPLSSGFSELPGFNFIVSFGAEVDEAFTIPENRVGGVFMHELGHNFGLAHGGVYGSSEACWTFKPNYISVMDYSYINGILFAATVGSTTPIGWRLDYSRAALPALDETNLNEFVGVQAGTTDIVEYYCNSSLAQGPGQGPIDWNCNGTIDSHASMDIDNDNGSANAILHGFDDWSYVKQQLQIHPDTIDKLPKRAVH